jgi:hypothetical protein
MIANKDPPERADHYQLELIRGEASHRTVTDLGPTLEEGLGEVYEENVIGDFEPDQLLPTMLHVPRPALFSSRIASGIINTIQSAESFENAAIQLGSRHLGMGRLALSERTQTKRHLLDRWFNVTKNFKEETWSFALVSALMLMLFGLFIGDQVLAISVAGIFSGPIGLSESPSCGNWDFFNNILTMPQLLSGMATVDIAQQRSISYVDSCYSNEAVTEGCNIYYNRTVSYSEEHNTSCPFPGDVCLYGQTSAYTLDTGFTDSNLLGINAAKRYQFRRRTTCSPVVTNSSYIGILTHEIRTDVPQLAAYFYGANASGLLYFTQPTDYLVGYPDYGNEPGYYRSYVQL